MMKSKNSIKIEKVWAREILDSRGNPTVEVDITLANGAKGRAAVPSGASTGSREALELRDGDPKRYGKKGVLKAVNNVNKEIAPAIKGMDVFNQSEMDQKIIKLDGTENKEKFGANALLGVSLAVAKAAAISLNVPLYRYLGGTDARILPCPMYNVMNGGMHANWQGSDFQEYMFCPIGAKSFAENLRWAAEIYQELKSIIKSKDYTTGVGDEGGFAPMVKSNEESVELICKAIEKSGKTLGKDVALCLDVASSSIFDEEKKIYQLRTEKRNVSTGELIDLFKAWVGKYPIISIEDGLAEGDWAGWKELTKALGSKIQLVGDDLFVTNIKYIQKGINEQSANAVLIKLNQIGTLTETLSAISMAKKAGWGAVVSHRSGETVDSFISDLVVATNTGVIKTGAPCRGERVEKYNQLLRIEEELGANGKFAGRTGFVH